MIFVDSWAWIALADRSDPYHRQAKTQHKTLLRAKRRYVTTDYILGETITKGSTDAVDMPAAPGAVLMQALVKADYREAFLEIRQVEPDHKLVTGIEVLSPSNKRPGTKGWRLYYRKRQAYLGGYANFVEIDLRRGGQRMPMMNPWPDSPYYLLLKYKKRRHCVVWPVHSIESLPPLTIPLTAPDPDISLALQPLVDAIYARSRYGRDIDYRRPLTPPLSAAEQTWLNDRLREQETKA